MSHNFDDLTKTVYGPINHEPIKDIINDIDIVLFEGVLKNIGYVQALKCFIEMLNKDTDEDDYDVNLRCALQDAYDEYIGKFQGEKDVNTND